MLSASRYKENRALKTLILLSSPLAALDVSQLPFLPLDLFGCCPGFSFSLNIWVSGCFLYFPDVLVYIFPTHVPYVLSSRFLDSVGERFFFSLQSFKVNRLFPSHHLCAVTILLGFGVLVKEAEQKHGWITGFTDCFLVTS